MSKAIKLTLLTIITFSSALYADYTDFDFYDGNFSCCEESRLEVGADLIWWKPCIDHLDFAGTSLSTLAPTVFTVEDELKSINQKWEPGVRINLQKKGVCCGLGVYATYDYLPIHSKSTLSTVGSTETVLTPLLNPFSYSNAGTGNTILGIFKFAEAKFRGTYHYCDLAIDYPICWGCHSFKPYFGPAGIVFNQKLSGEFTDPEIEIQGDTGEMNWRSNAWGVGLKIGTDYEYGLGNGISLFTRAEGALLAGKFTSRFNQVTANGITGSSTDYSFKKSSKGCHLFPGYHFAAGFNYRGCVWENQYTIRVGYELLSWQNLSNQPVFTSTSSAQLGTSLNSSSLNRRTLAFHGLYVGAELKF